MFLELCVKGEQSLHKLKPAEALQNLSLPIPAQGLPKQLQHPCVSQEILEKDGKDAPQMPVGCGKAQLHWERSSHQRNFPSVKRTHHPSQPWISLAQHLHL